MNRLLIGLVLVLSLPHGALAHPGHGATPAEPNSVMHYLVEPIHVPTAIAMGLSVALILFLASRRFFRSR